MKKKLKTKLRNAYLKSFNKEQYKREKELIRQLKKSRLFAGYDRNGYFNLSPGKEAATFTHSGHTGDIIYSLPTVRALSRSANLLLKIDAPAMLPFFRKHPYGASRLTAQAAEMLKPLLESQDYVQSVRIFHKEDAVDFDLDAFRLTPMDLAMGSMPYYYFPIFGVAPDVSQPWLDAPQDEGKNEYIILARSTRYRNEALDYSFLAEYPKVGFVGIESEFIEMQAKIKHLEYFPVSDFLQLATIIRSAKLFIGNQSFPFSLAEAMKVPRLLEVCPLVPNVIPAGGVAHPVWFQRQFRYLVSELA